MELAELQDKEVGDGTTSVVIVAAELLKVSCRFLFQWHLFHSQLCMFLSPLADVMKKIFLMFEMTMIAVESK